MIGFRLLFVMAAIFCVGCTDDQADKMASLSRYSAKVEKEIAIVVAREGEVMVKQSGDAAVVFSLGGEELARFSPPPGISIRVYEKERRISAEGVRSFYAMVKMSEMAAQLQYPPLN